MELGMDQSETNKNMINTSRKFNVQFCMCIKMQTHVCQSMEEKMKGDADIEEVSSKKI